MGSEKDRKTKKVTKKDKNKNNKNLEQPGIRTEGLSHESRKL
jgi:hypothetical protein